MPFYSLTRYRVLVLILVGLIVWQLVKLLPKDVTLSITPGDEIDKIENPKYNVHRSKKIQINVYYESLCPDSKYFITDQLEPVVTALSDYVKVVLVPYGKATTKPAGEDDYRFKCQHGNPECQGNIVHACTAHQLADVNNALAVKMAACMIEDNKDYMGALDKCASRLSVNAEPIRQCAKSKAGRELLAAAGKLTDAVAAPLSFVPVAAIDGAADRQNEVLSDLKRVICQKIGVPLPSPCL